MKLTYIRTTKFEHFSRFSTCSLESCPMLWKSSYTTGNGLNQETGGGRQTFKCHPSKNWFLPLTPRTPRGSDFVDWRVLLCSRGAPTQPETRQSLLSEQKKNPMFEMQLIKYALVMRTVKVPHPPRLRIWRLESCPMFIGIPYTTRQGIPSRDKQIIHLKTNQKNAYRQAPAHLEVNCLHVEELSNDSPR